MTGGSSSVVCRYHFCEPDVKLDQQQQQQRSSVVRASELKSEDPGFDPLAGRGEAGDTVFLFLRVNSRADVFVPEHSPPPFVCTTRSHI